MDATITLLWNNQRFCKVSCLQHNLREEILRKTREKGLEKGILQYHFKKFSKNTNKYMSTNLKNLMNGDKVNVIPTSISGPTENQHLLIMKSISRDDDSGFRNRLMEKISTNNHLTDQDREYTFHFLKFHENCSGAANSSDIHQTNDVMTSNGKRARDSIDSDNSKKIKTANVRIQCNRPFVPDYEPIIKYLREYETSEEKDEDNFNAFSRMLYDQRRAFIMNSAPSVEVFQECHPYMFNFSQVFAEFKHITQRDDIYEKFQSNVEKYCHSVLELVPPTPTGNMIQKKIDEAKNEETKNWIRIAGSLLLLPKYMREDRESILLCSNQHAVQENRSPYISHAADSSSCLRKPASFKVFIEGIKLCTAHNLVDAYFALVASYYIFNAEYPTICANSFALIEHLYLEYTDQSNELTDFVKERIKRLKKHCNKSH